MTTAAELIEREEIESLKREYDWVLETEVKHVWKELRAILSECVSKFPAATGSENSGGSSSHRRTAGSVSSGGREGSPERQEAEKFVMSTPSTTPLDQVKVVVTLNGGDSITHADINLKLPRAGNKDLYQNTTIREEFPWRLQQIQDAGNHLQMAVSVLDSVEDDYKFKSSEELSFLLTTLMGYLQRSRAALVNPKKRTLEELQKNKNVKGFQPALPPELALSFYLQGWKLIFAVYHIITEKGVSKFNRYQAECVIPWVNDVLLLLTVGLQAAQQLKDKISVFEQYQDVLST